MNTCQILLIGKKGVSGAGNKKSGLLPGLKIPVTDDWSEQFVIKKYILSGIYQISAFSSL
jgi:hypothetical protein